MTRQVRPRGRRRRGLVFAALALMLFSAVAVFHVVRARERTELPDFREAHEPLLERYQVDREGRRLRGANRWDLLASLTLMHEQVKANVGLLAREHLLAVNLTGLGAKEPDEVHVKALNVIAEYERLNLPDLLDELAAAERLVRPPQAGPAFEWLLPEIAGFNYTSEISSLRFQLVLQSGDVAEAARTFEHTLALARAATHDPYVVSHSVAYRVTVRGLALLRIFLMEEPRSAADIRLFQLALERQSLQLPLALAIEGHQLLEYETIGWLYDHPEYSPAQAFLNIRTFIDPPSRARALIEVRTQWGDLPTREEAIRGSRDLNDKYLAAARGPHHELLAAMAAADTHATTLTMQVSPASFLMPLPRQLSRLYLVSRAELDGMRIMMAIELHRAETGRYPLSLQELVPNYLESLPPDPYTGDDFFYRLFQPEEDEHGRGYILYSTGPNQQDDGGLGSTIDARAIIRDPRMPFAIGTEGVDLVINRVAAPKQDEEDEDDESP